MYTVQCTVQYTVYSVHYSVLVYSVHYSVLVYSVQSKPSPAPGAGDGFGTVYSVHCKLYSVHCTVWETIMTYMWMYNSIMSVV